MSFFLRSFLNRDLDAETLRPRLSVCVRPSLYNMIELALISFMLDSINKDLTLSSDFV